jgi:Glycosyltransferase family 87
LKALATRRAYIFLAFAVIAASSMLDYHLRLFIPQVLHAREVKGLGNGYAFGDDFYPIWLTTRQWRNEHRDLYSTGMTREIQIGLFGRALDARNPLDPPTDYRSFAYPAFADLLFWPTAAVEFQTLRVALGIVLPMFVAGSLWLWIRALRWRISPMWFVIITLLGICNYPILEALFAAQPGLVVGLLIAASAWAIRSNRPLFAGVLASLTLIKPQMTILAIAYLLLWSLADRRRWPFAAGFLGTTTLLSGASLLIWPRWIGDWLHVVFGYHRYATPPLVNELLGPALAARIGWFIIAALVVLGFVFAWKNRRDEPTSTNFWLTLSLLLAITSVSLLPGQAIYDHVILFPGIIFLLQHWQNLRSSKRVPRMLPIVGAIVFFWPWIAAFGLVVARSWLAPQQFYSNAFFALPIRTAASFPFVVLILLAFSIRVNAMPESEPS